jgi:hypothetical protein
MSHEVYILPAFKPPPPLSNTPLRVGGVCQLVRLGYRGELFVAEHRWSLRSLRCVEDWRTV